MKRNLYLQFLILIALILFTLTTAASAQEQETSSNNKASFSIMKLRQLPIDEVPIDVGGGGGIIITTPTPVYIYNTPTPIPTATSIPIVPTIHPTTINAPISSIVSPSNPQTTINNCSTLGNCVKTPGKCTQINIEESLLLANQKIDNLYNILNEVIVAYISYQPKRKPRIDIVKKISPLILTNSLVAREFLTTSFPRTIVSCEPPVKNCSVISLSTSIEALAGKILKLSKSADPLLKSLNFSKKKNARLAAKKLILKLNKELKTYATLMEGFPNKTLSCQGL